mmetsp:Transcript_11967/g.29277  ORF Transcript_11967/g.29277 Transcript_11967/m.29277 type:complete len:93 (-) Transcript_11967:87-365(-)
MIHINTRGVGPKVEGAWLPIALLKNGKAENLSATSIIVLTLDDNIITCHYRVRSRHDIIFTNKKKSADRIFTNPIDVQLSMPLTLSFLPSSR